MYKILLIITFLFISNCTINKVIKNHGISHLEKKEAKLIVNITNSNEIIDLIGPPSTVGTFDNNLWIYIERKHTKSNLFTLGKKKLLLNNVLVLEITQRGVLKKKTLLDLNNMNDLEYSVNRTESALSKQSFVYEFLSSLRQKINRSNRSK